MEGAIPGRRSPAASCGRRAPGARGSGSEIPRASLVAGSGGRRLALGLRGACLGARLHGSVVVDSRARARVRLRPFSHMGRFFGGPQCCPERRTEQAARGMRGFARQPVRSPSGDERCDPCAKPIDRGVCVCVPLDSAFGGVAPACLEAGGSTLWGVTRTCERSESELCRAWRGWRGPQVAIERLSREVVPISLGQAACRVALRLAEEAEEVGHYVRQ